MQDVRKVVGSASSGWLTAVGPWGGHAARCAVPSEPSPPPPSCWWCRCVAGVVVGGLGGRVSSVAAGFLVYDFVFVRPYDTLTVGAAQDWVALGVYVVVMVLVARIVARLESARAEPTRASEAHAACYELSELLVEDRPLEELLETIVDGVQTSFDVHGRGAACCPSRAALSVVASRATPISPERAPPARARVAGCRCSVGTGTSQPTASRPSPCRASERPVGLLAMRGVPAVADDRELLRDRSPTTLALALERAQLREQASCTPRCSRRSTACGTPSSARSHTTFAPPGDHEGRLFDPPRPDRPRSPRATPTSCTA